MSTRSRTVAITAAGLLLAVALGACAQEDTGETSLPPTSAPPATEAPLEEGEHFGLVNVDESDEIVLGIDLAEMLTGEEAREAAVEEGFIEEDEELDTDFYISNPEQVIELVPIAPDAEITVISGTDTAQKIEVDAATFKTLYDGTYTGDPVYGIVAGQPIAMDLVIEDGMVSEAHAIYLP